MSIDIFVPEFWVATLRRHLDSTLRYGQPTVINRNYQGEISGAGDTVHIQRVGTPTIKTYTKNTDIADPERPDGDSLALTIDQQKYFNIAIDDVDAAQVNAPLLNTFGVRAARAMAVVIDGFIAGKQVAGADTDNFVGTDDSPVVVKADGSGDYTPYELMVELRRKFANQDAPLEDLWAVITPDMEAQFLLDERYIEFGAAPGDSNVVRNGLIGRIAGFDVLSTTAAPSSEGTGGEKVANHKIVAGAGNYATTYADQVVETKAYEIEKQFGDAVKGLQVYGAKVQEPETLAVAHVAD